MITKESTTGAPGLKEQIQAAYEEWCRPRMSSMVPDHPAHAFEAGYRAAMLTAERDALRDVLEYVAREYGRFMSDRDRQKVGAALSSSC